jgi:menaquinone-dependent protoporphyrinogen IX oxidase
MLDSLTEEERRRAVIVRHMNRLKVLAYETVVVGAIVRQKHFMAALERACERLRVLDRRA